MRKDISVTPAMIEQGGGFIFHHDGGHGWLEVSASDLSILGINEGISHYSYQNNGKVYLEEDCDLPKFLDAFALYYGLDRNGANFEKCTKCVYDGDSSPIRQYQSYRI